MLRNIDEENKGYTFASWWFNIYRNELDTFEEILTLDDTMTGNGATRVEAGFDHAIDEPEPSSKWCGHK